MRRKLKWLGKIGTLAVVIALVEWAHRSMPPKWGERMAGFLASGLCIAVWELWKHAIADAREKAARAEAAAEALAGLCRVDEYELPLPEDDRWVREDAKNTTSANGQILRLLKIGNAIAVEDVGDVYLDRKMVPRTYAKHAYALRVWRAYHQRALNKLSG